MEEGKCHALSDLDCLELHLQLKLSRHNTHNMRSRLDSIAAAFKALEHLRFLRPSRALVAIQYTDSFGGPWTTNGQLTELAERYRKRLLDPEASDEDRLERLADGIKELEESWKKEEMTLKENRKNAQLFQAKADCGRETAINMRDKIDGLQDIMGRDQAWEIKEVLDKGLGLYTNPH